MSSEESGLAREPSAKRRRVARACDNCRRRKVKCDGTEARKCSICVDANTMCTFVHSAPIRPHRKPPSLCSRCYGSVEDALPSDATDVIRLLEARIVRMDTLLRKFMSSEEIKAELNDGLDSFDDTSPSDNASPQPNSTTDEPNGDEVDDLQDALSALNLKSGYYHGRSSGASLFLQAAEFKKTIGGGTLNAPFPLKAMFEYPWEITLPCEPAQRPFEFPPDDLLFILTDIYFEKWNIFIPILHRPTFMNLLQAGLHFTNRAFGANVLLVCAAASRFSDDHRVLMSEYGFNPLTCGWKYINQLNLLPDSTIFAEPGSELFNLQFYALVVVTLTGATHKMQMLWILLGIGIRLGQHLGADRKKKGPLTVQGELMKRAWWALVVYDKILAHNLGRSPAVREEEFVHDLPVECDDEYWENPDPQQMFKQPNNKPARATSFVRVIELARLMGMALRTFYIPRSKDVSYRQPLEDLDSALNAWEQNLPDHLRWDPHREDTVFFLQSAYIRNVHHLVQILVHRPFIPSPGRAANLTTPSLSICANAARSCIRTLEAVVTRNISIDYGWFKGGAFTSAVILSLSVMVRKQEGNTRNLKQEMDEVQRCITILATCNERWRFASQMLESLTDLISLGDAHPDESLPRGQKRERPQPSEAGEAFVNPSANATIPEDPQGFTNSDLLVQPAATDCMASDASQPIFNFNTFFNPQYNTSHPDDFGFWPSFPTSYSSSEDWNAFMSSLQFPNMGVSDSFSPTVTDFGGSQPYNESYQ